MRRRLIYFLQLNERFWFDKRHSFSSFIPQIIGCICVCSCTVIFFVTDEDSIALYCVDDRFAFSLSVCSTLLVTAGR